MPSRASLAHVPRDRRSGPALNLSVYGTITGPRLTARPESVLLMSRHSDFAPGDRLRPITSRPLHRWANIPPPRVLIKTSVRGDFQRFHSDSDGLGADVNVGPDHTAPSAGSRCWDACSRAERRPPRDPGSLVASTEDQDRLPDRTLLSGGCLKMQVVCSRASEPRLRAGYQGRTQVCGLGPHTPGACGSCEGPLSW